LLSYWGLPNLQVINRDAHATKPSRLGIEDSHVD
jgi:hypothetical protein